MNSLVSQNPSWSPTESPRPQLDRRRLTRERVKTFEWCGLTESNAQVRHQILREFYDGRAWLKTRSMDSLFNLTWHVNNPPFLDDFPVRNIVCPVLLLVFCSIVVNQKWNVLTCFDDFWYVEMLGFSTTGADDALPAEYVRRPEPGRVFAVPVAEGRTDHCGEWPGQHHCGAWLGCSADAQHVGGGRFSTVKTWRWNVLTFGRGALCFWMYLGCLSTKVPTPWNE